MSIHKEGYKIIFNSLLIIIAFSLLFHQFTKGYPTAKYYIFTIALLLFILILRFFRAPKREAISRAGRVIAPADGKIVEVKEVYEPEYFKKEVIQVSIFMTIFNVHINWFPVDGLIKYFKYHPGNYLVASHPKSSKKNERTTVVVEHQGDSVLIRQIAGYIARRIVCYAEEQSSIKTGEELGFIKFGSRVDLFIPLESRVQVTKGQKVKGCETLIATLPSFEEQPSLPL